MLVWVRVPPSAPMKDLAETARSFLYHRSLGVIAAGENAIWHGLMNKEGKGHLNITIRKENDFLNCVITDDGIGRAKAGALNSGSAKKERSMGLKITTERLSLFNQDKEVNTFYEIDDVLDESGTVAGTKVSIKIRYKNLMEAVA